MPHGVVKYDADGSIPVQSPIIRLVGRRRNPSVRHFRRDRHPGAERPGGCAWQPIAARTMPGRLAGTIVLAGAVLCASGSPCAARAQQRTALQQEAGQRTRLFNIPAKPLHQALEAFSAVTGMALIYDSALARKRWSKPVIGLFAPEVALRMMLEGTDLTIRYNSPTDIMLVSMGEAKAPAAVGLDPGGAAAATLVLDTLYVDVAPGSRQRPDFTGYSRVVVSELKRALRQNPETADRIYQVQLDIWINDRGQLRHPRLVKSTGRRQLDQAINRVVESTTLKNLPPKDMPQPVRFTIIAL